MKKLVLFFVISAAACLPCHAFESRFLEEMSGVLSIKADSVMPASGGIVLGNCSVVLLGAGRGSIRSLQIINESPGKVGRLVLEDVRFPGMVAQRAEFENIRGNFAALAPALPILFHMQGYALANPSGLAQELGMLKALLPPLKQFHIDRLTLSGLRTTEAGEEFEFRSVAYSNVNFASVGAGLIQGGRIKSSGRMIGSIEEVSWDSVVPRNIDALLNLDPGQLAPAEIKPSSIQNLFNLTIKNLLVKNARVPVIGLSVGEGKLNIDSQPGTLNAGAAFKNLRLPGMLLAMAGLENPPEMASFDGLLRIKAAYDDDSYAAIQKFSFTAADLFLLSGKGGIEGSFTAGEDDFTLTDVHLTFQNRGLVGCLSTEMKNQVSQWIKVQAPGLGQIMARLLAGDANSLTISFEDSSKLEDLKISVE